MGEPLAVRIVWIQAHGSQGSVQMFEAGGGEYLAALKIGLGIEHLAQVDHGVPSHPKRKSCLVDGWSLHARNDENAGIENCR
jgi:hypothetical protein